MKTIWKGYLKISLVTIPVRMYNATTRRRPIQFNQLHEACHTRIREQKVCPKCNQAVSKEEIVRGYPYGKDAYVIMTDEDFEKAQEESTDSIEVFKFVDSEQIAPIYHYSSHYLIPDGRAGEDTYVLFHRAMEKTRKSAVAKVVMRNREHLLSIGAHNGTLIAYTLHYPRELLDYTDLLGPSGVIDRKVDQKSLDMAETIIDNLSGDFAPEAHEDEYTRTLMEIIQAKVEGQEVEAAPREEEGKVVNLMDALKQSVKETRKAPKKEMAKAGKGKRTKKSQKNQKKG